MNNENGTVDEKKKVRTVGILIHLFILSIGESKQTQSTYNS